MTVSESQHRSRTAHRLGALAALLLLLALATNLGAIRQMLSRKGAGKATDTGLPRIRSATTMVFPALSDLGPPHARVTVEAFLKVKSHCTCDWEAGYLALALHAIEPTRLRVLFRDTGTPEGTARMRQVNGLRSAGGLAVNGKYQFKVAVPRSDGASKVETVDLMSGQLNRLDQVWAVLNNELKLAYHGQGLALNPSEFAQRVGTEMGRAASGERPQGRSARALERGKRPGRTAAAAGAPTRALPAR